MKERKYTAEEMAAFRAASDVNIAKWRSSPGFDEAVAEARAEMEAMRIASELVAKTNKTQGQIASDLGISQARVSRIANAKRMTLTTLYKFAAACGYELKMSLRPLGKAAVL